MNLTMGLSGRVADRWMNKATSRKNMHMEKGMHPGNFRVQIEAEGSEGVFMAPEKHFSSDKASRSRAGQFAL